MISQYDRLYDYARGAWRFRRIAVIVAWATFAVLAILVCLIPNKYESRAQLLVNSSTVLEPLLQGVAVAEDSSKQADIVKRGLLARPTLERVARESGLYAQATTPEARDLVAANLEKDLKIDGSLQSRVYTISYSHRDPKTARAVVASLLDTFVRGSASAQSTDAQEAKDFFNQQVNEVAARLTEAERNLAEFKKKNLGLMPDDRGDYFARLQQEMAQMDKIRAELAVAQSQQSELRAKIVEGAGPSAVLQSPTPEQIQQATNLDAQIAQSRRDLDTLLLKYTDEHPQVLSMRDTIARLERRRAELGGNVRATGGSLGDPDKGGNGVISSLQIALNGADLQVASLSAEYAQARRRVAELHALASVRPEVEAELARLNRDYGVTKERYAALLQRLESAKTSNQVEENTASKFQVLEQPRVPIRPSSPPRLMLLAGAFLAALGAGVIVAGGLSTLRPVYMTRRAVEDSLQLPVLGVIWLSVDEEVKAARQSALRTDAVWCGALMFALLLLGLIANPASAFLRRLLGSES